MSWWSVMSAVAVGYIVGRSVVEVIRKVIAIYLAW